MIWGCLAQGPWHPFHPQTIAMSWACSQLLPQLSAAPPARRECLDQPDSSCSHPQGCAQEDTGCRYISFPELGHCKSLFLSPRDLNSGPLPSSKTVLSLSSSSPHQPVLRPHSAHCLGPCPSTVIQVCQGPRGFQDTRLSMFMLGQWVDLSHPYPHAETTKSLHHQGPYSQATCLLSTRKALQTTSLWTSSFTRLSSRKHLLFPSSLFPSPVPSRTAVN